MRQFSVSKRDEHGQETWRYQACLLEQNASYVVLEAYFDRHDTPVAGIVLEKGDRFVETYYFDRWYNIFEIHARETDQLRGWYCNIGMPAVLEGDTLSYIDLALDLVVFPGGEQVLLDEDEFTQLDIPQETRQYALYALAELRHHFDQHKDPAR